VVETKYDSIGGSWRSKEIMESFGVGVWKHIRKWWEKFSNFVKFEVGIRSKVSMFLA
jgi:hypothetical protein